MSINLSTPLARAWKRRLKRWRESGLSAAEFSRREKISAPRLYTWRQRFAEAATSPEAHPATFVPAQIIPSPGLGAVELALKSGQILRLPVDISAARLAEIVQALAAC